MTRRSRIASWAAAALLGPLVLGACTDALPTGTDSSLEGRPRIAPVTLLVSDTNASVGSRITVQIRVVVEGGALHAIEGGLAYDASTLRFVGQPGPDNFPVVVNPDLSATGEIRFLAFSATGLPAEFVSLTFEVRGREYARSLDYRHRNAVRGRGASVSVDLGGRAALTQTEARLVPSAARILTIDDWRARLVPTQVAVADVNPNADVARYGDVTLDQRIDLHDYLAVAFAAVGNDELILRRAGEREIDLVTAGNVWPAIDGQSCGVEASGHRELSLFDYLAIAFEAVGEDEPCVGDVIPGRASSLLPRVTLRASDLLVKRGSTRHFSADTLWAFKGVLRVEEGGRAVVAAGAVLEFAEGPRHGFRASSGLLVQRGGTLVARGTVAAPIVLRCYATDSSPGCWGGVDIEGSGSDADPIALEHLRIEYAGAAGGQAGRDAAGLRLIDMAERAMVRRVQVHGAQGSGLEVHGGDVSLSEVLLTGNSGAALRFTGTPSGRHERIIVQAPAHTTGVLGGVEIDTDPPADTSVGTLQLERLTLVGNLAPRHTPAVWLNGRAATRITGLVVAGYGSGIQRSTSSPCNAQANWTALKDGAFVQADSTSSAAACIHVEEVVAEDAGQWLRGAFETERPDWRPVVGAPAVAGRGAAEAARVGVIPWFAGWSRGFRAGTAP